VVGGACGTNGGEEGRVYGMRNKARGQEHTRKTKMEVSGYYCHERTGSVTYKTWIPDWLLELFA
jgi:hypothetical protein